MHKKIFILLPDGVGLRNFAYTNFYDLAKTEGFDVTFWNDTPFDLKSLGFNEIRIENSKTHPVTNILKRVRVQIDLSRNVKKSHDAVYDTYRFGFSYKNLKEILRTLSIKSSIFLHSSEKGIRQVRKNIIKREKTTDFYNSCLEILKIEKPDLVFCTNQRTVLAIAPIEAAKELGIPTATFIFSWDNLPKATMALETDYYFVWSDHMKNELLFYYDYIREDQVFVTGTPQFEPHTYKNNIVSRDVFFAEYGLKAERKYICYSGDDVTTSPNDAQYLADTAEAIKRLNAKGNDLGLIFRRCPVDFSDRYDTVLEKYKDIIAAIDPKWESSGGAWNSILPTKADLDLQMNTIGHSEMVINLGSSMVFDFVSFGKPCAYINYDVKNSIRKNWSVKKIYNYVHFRSMPSKDVVVWLNNPEEIAAKIESALSRNGETVREAQRWFERINLHPVENASVRILQAFGKIIAQSKK